MIKNLACLRKSKYKNQLTAERYAVKVMHRSPEVQLWTYKCPSCDQWHLTNKRQSVNNVNNNRCTAPESSYLCQ